MLPTAQMRHGVHRIIRPMDFSSSLFPLGWQHHQLGGRNGCTSGHSICGLGSLQWPSLLAVLTLVATAFITAHPVAWSLA